MIVKNLLVVGVVAGFASAAAAADGEKANWAVSGKIRMDAVQSSTDTTKGTAAKTTAKSSEIKLKRAQFKLSGKQGSDSMEFKIYADKFNSTDIGDALDTAVISHKFSDMITASFGKMGVLAQSWENDYSSTDQYLYSMISDYAPANANGAQVDLAFGDHNIAIQGVQGVSSYDDYTFEAEGGLSTSVQYRGEINKMIRPLITYTMVKASDSAGTKTEDGVTTSVNMGNGLTTQLGAGVQVDAAGATIDVEYDSVKIHKAKSDTTGKDQNATAMIAQVKYPFGATTALVKFASDSLKKGAASDVGDVSKTGMAVGAEHKLDGNCRLHAVYTSENKTTKGAASSDTKVAKTGFNFGVTASM